MTVVTRLRCSLLRCSRAITIQHPKHAAWSTPSPSHLPKKQVRHVRDNQRIISHSGEEGLHHSIRVYLPKVGFPARLGSVLEWLRLPTANATVVSIRKGVVGKIFFLANARYSTTIVKPEASICFTVMVFECISGPCLEY